MSGNVKGTLANQQPEEKWKSLNNNNNSAAQEE